jgi:hypothetical protein
MTLASLRARAPLTLIALALALAFVALAAPATTFAHETRTVATDYELVVGFIEEPAIQNDTNGIFLEVTKGGEPVEGLADTLRAEVIYGDQKREATLGPASGEKGVYTSVFIPTEPGDYTFRIFGKVGDQDIDETFTSSPEGFDSVAPRIDYEFPTGANGAADSTLAFPAAIGGVVLAAGALTAIVRRARR